MSRVRALQPAAVPDAPAAANVQQRASHELSEGPGWTLHRGLWQAVLADIQADALIADPPYSARTHSSETTRSDSSDASGLTPDYDPWTADDVQEFVSSWSPRVRGWMVCLTDHVLIDAYTRAYEAAGRYAFAPVACCIRAMSHRMQADGPSSWVVYAMVARPRSREFVDEKWSSHGFYVGNSVRYGRRGGSASGKGRGKPPWLEHALVRDFSRAGDVVCDPLAGFGGTLAAVVSLGRSAIGAECDPAAYTEAVRRLRRPLQVDMFAGATSAEESL